MNYGTAPLKETKYLPISVFIALVFVLAILGKAIGGTPEQPGFGFFLWVLSPTLSCLIIRTWTKDWKQFGIRLKIKSKSMWYLVSLLAFPVIMLLSVLIGKWMGIITIKDFILSDYLQSVVPAFIAFFIFAICEEVGWRGYLSPKLAALQVKAGLIYFIVGLVWTLWHFPYIKELTFLYVKEDLLTFVPRYFVGITVLAFVYHELRMLSDSFWPGVLLHATGNAMGHLLAANHIVLETGADQIAAIGTGYISILLYLLLGMFLYFHRIKKKYETTRS